MRFQTLISAVLLATATQATPAPVVNGNPAGVQYVAVLPDKNDTTVRGTIQVSSVANGTGVNVQVSISGLPAQGGPYAYHIHQFPAPALNCAAAGGHLDPYKATDCLACDTTQPDKCQVGDLSGKHGNMSSPSFTANYIDLYLSTQPGTPAFIGNRSIVVHFANGTRVSCANFTMPTGPASGQSVVVSTVTTVTVTYNAATAQPPSVAPLQTSSSSIPVTTALVQATTTVTVLSTPAAAVSTVLATQILTSYVTALASPFPATSSQAITTISPTTSSVVLTTISQTYVQAPSTRSPSIWTATANVVSMVVVVPARPTTTTVLGSVTLTQSTNGTQLATVVEPYTIVETSTLVSTAVLALTSVLTVPTSLTSVLTIPGITTNGPLTTELVPGLLSIPTSILTSALDEITTVIPTTLIETTTLPDLAALTTELSTILPDITAPTTDITTTDPTSTPDTTILPTDVATTTLPADVPVPTDISAAAGVRYSKDTMRVVWPSALILLQGLAFFLWH